MASYNETINAAARLLECLESGAEPPLPFMMKRLTNLLVRRYGYSAEEATTTPPEKEPLAPNPTTVIAEEEESWDEEDDEPFLSPANEKERSQFLADVERLEGTTQGPLYVDVQCLVTASGESVIKEIAIGCGSVAAWIVVRAPEYAVADRGRNGYIKSSINGLEWDGGAIRRKELRRVTARLFDGRRRIYITGDATVLRTHLGVPSGLVKDLEHVGDLKLLRESTDREEKCRFHLNRHYKLACARWHVAALIRECR